METGGLSAIQIILVVLAANTILILGAYGLVQWWRMQSMETIRQIGTQIQAYADQLNQIAGFLQEFSGISDEPYATHLDELQEQASQLQINLNKFTLACRNFEESTRAPTGNRLQEIINAPVTWFKRWRQSSALRKESREYGEQLSEIEERVQRILELPWDQATQSRQADQDLAELIEIAQDLHARGAQGSALKLVLDQIPQLQRAMDEIPDEFLQADHDTLLNTANLDATIRVYTVLSRIRPAIDRYLPQVRDWQVTFQKAAADFDALKLAGANLRQALARTPAGLVTAPLQDRLDQVAQMAGDLGQQVAQPDVQNLKPLGREVSHLVRVLQDLEQQFNRSSQQVSQLSQWLTELQDGLDQLTEQAAGLERAAGFPLVLDDSSNRLVDLRKRLQALGSPQQPRTPDQVTQHLREAEALRDSHKSLSASFPKIIDQHRALLTLLESHEIKEGAAWIRQSQEMLNQASAYDPRNWPKQDAIQTLPADLEALSQMHQRLAPPDRSAPVKETELAQRLKETQQLAALHKSLRPRIAAARTRLDKVQAWEKESKDRLSEAFSALEMVSILSESNDVIEEAAGAEIDHLGEELRQSGSELNARDQGEVEKKLQKISAQADKVNRALNNWLNRLNSAISEKGKAVQASLVQLDSIAHLEEQPVMEARRLLAEEDYLSAVSASQATAAQTGPLRSVAARVSRHSQLSDLEATAQIKRKNDLWQKLSAAQQSMAERTEALVKAYKDTVKARSEAQEGLNEVAKRIPQQRTWPPNNQAPLTEAQLLRPIDEKWDGLKKQTARIETAILEMGRLAQQYLLASERLEQLLDRVEQDEERVRDLEEQIADLKQRWQEQAQSEASSPVVREGIHQLMSDSDAKLSFIKHQYMRGALSYEQIIHSLTLLYDDLLAARVAVNDRDDIGLSGNNRRSQQSTH